ncbi:hypothetical protein PAECIP111892_00188 [Paenibacillus auburnensis]|uniref:Uncharacterized protein n=1 Tax=Paenibacillus auburnensis TaxID=2905649 RepID=A0ABN8FQX2_9BACL|nr:hypothetical protein [Paenibacillus auburnensis]CAH1190438.1 hypothetical protein PAECIP111892_00188 [Paenibacillus auburnensis]
MRSRNENGRYRHKRGEAMAGNFEKKYGSDVGVRSEVKLETLKRLNDSSVITPLLKEQQHKE